MIERIPKFLQDRKDGRDILKDDMRKLTDESLIHIKEMCGDDFRLWDICEELLEEREPIKEMDE